MAVATRTTSTTTIASVADAEARAALATVVPRLTELIRTVRRPSAPALGEWNAGQVATHLAHAWEILPKLARREGEPVLTDLRQLDAFTVAMVRADSDSNVEAAAARVEAAAAAHLASPLGGDDPRPWLVAGISFPPSVFSCHLLNESLVHGFDIARAEGRRWDIDPRHAALAITGFLLPVMSRLDPRFAIDQRAAAGVHARYDIRLRGCARFSMTIDDGALHVEPGATGRADWHISADPATLFLVMWSRTTPWAGLLSGRMLGWGRKPLLGLRMTRMLRNP